MNKKGGVAPADICHTYFLVRDHFINVPSGYIKFLPPLNTTNHVDCRLNGLFGVLLFNIIDTSNSLRLSKGLIQGSAAFG